MNLQRSDNRSVLLGTPTHCIFVGTISYRYTIVLSGLFELYTRGGCLNHEAKPSGLNVHLERTIQ